MNTIMEEKVKAMFSSKSIQDICVKEFCLRMKYQRQRDKLFGEVGCSEFGKVDLLHLRGAKGRQLYTESMVRLVNSLKGGRARSKVNLPRLKEHSVRKPGNTCTVDISNHLILKTKTINHS